MKLSRQNLDQLSEVSDAAVQKDIAKTREFLARFQAIDTAGFPEQEALNKTLMVRGLQEGLDTDVSVIPPTAPVRERPST